MLLSQQQPRILPVMERWMVDFRLTEEQEFLESSMASFVDREVIRAAAGIDEEGRFPSHSSKR